MSIVRKSAKSEGLQSHFSALGLEAQNSELGLGALRYRRVVIMIRAHVDGTRIRLPHCLFSGWNIFHLPFPYPACWLGLVG